MNQRLCRANCPPKKIQSVVYILATARGGGGGEAKPLCNIYSSESIWVFGLKQKKVIT